MPRVRGKANGMSADGIRLKNLVNAGKACIWRPYRSVDETLEKTGLEDWENDHVGAPPERHS